MSSGARTAILCCHVYSAELQNHQSLIGLGIGSNDALYSRSFQAEGSGVLLLFSFCLGANRELPKAGGLLGTLLLPPQRRSVLAEWQECHSAIRRCHHMLSSPALPSSAGISAMPASEDALWRSQMIGEVVVTHVFFISHL